MKKSLIILAAIATLSIAGCANVHGTTVPIFLWPLAAVADSFGGSEPNQGQYIELDENGDVKPAKKASAP